MGAAGKAASARSASARSTMSPGPGGRVEWDGSERTALMAAAALILCFLLANAIW